MLVSVVIATYNRLNVLSQTLPSVIGQDYPSQQFEIILVVDGSTDGSAEWARSLKPGCTLEVLEQENRGPGAARNAGVAAARGDVLLFLDDDDWCQPRVVAKHAAGHEAEHGVAIHGAIFLSPRSPQTLAAMGTGWWYQSRHEALMRRGALSPNLGDVFLIPNSSLRRETFLETGGLDDELFPREDFEFGLRLQGAGVPMRYRPDAVAHELFYKSTREFGRQDARAQGRADVAICRRYPDHRPYSPLAPRDPPTALRTAARRTLLRLPRRADGALDPFVAVAERYIGYRAGRAAGDVLLSLQRQLAYERSASDAAGSASELEACLDRRLAVLSYRHMALTASGLPQCSAVSSRQFERHVRWLKLRGYRGVGASEWVAWREGRTRLPRKGVLFTFDDGCAELAEFAFPVLMRNGFPAIVFVVTGRMKDSTSWDARRPALEGASCLSAEQIVSWSRRGIEFGALGRTYRDLSDASEQELCDEICGSRSDLEEILGHRVEWFAYPYGRHSTPARKLVEETYTAAFTTGPAVNTLATPLHLLRRAAAAQAGGGVGLECRLHIGDR